MLLYNTQTGETIYFLELDEKPNEPIIVNLTYMQDTAPSNPQEKDIWYNTSNDKLYTYKNGQWIESDPSVGVFYLYNNQYYLWDGNSLEVTDLNIYEKIANKSTSINSQTANDITYPTTKAVSDYVTTKSFVKNFSDAGITQTSGTMVQLAQDIQSKHLETGTIVYGEITCSDMPFHGNAEVRVEVLETKGAPNYYQVLEFTLFSTTDAPYQWSFMYYEPQFTTWTWVPRAIPTNDYTSNSTSTVPSSKALSDGLKSIEPNLYDIKLLSQLDTENSFLKEKGWAFQCKSTRQDLAKTDVPTLYQDIKDKYDGSDKTTQTVTGITSFGSSLSMNSFTKAMNKYYIIGSDGLLYVALDYTSTSVLTKVNNYVTACILGTENFLLQFTYDGVVYRLTDNDTVEIYNFGFSFYGNNFNYKIFENEKYFILWNGGENTPSTANKTIFVVNDNGTLNTKVYNCSSTEQLCDIIKTNEYYYILTRSGVYNIKVYKGASLDNLDLLDTSKWELLLDNSTYYTRRQITMFYANGVFAIHKIEDSFGMLLYSDDEFENLYSLPDANYNLFIIQHNDEIYYMKNNILYSIRLELITGTWTTQNLSGEFLFSYYSQSDLLLIACQTSGYYRGTIYAIGFVKKPYTDTYYINGNTVDITYYKYMDFKICLSDNGGTNDTNLATVYSYMGYYNYYRLDTVNETVSLPRNSNLYSMMYVGDNYQDTLTGIPNGQYEAFALKSETKYLIKDIDISANITVALDKEHKAYKITTPTSDFSLAIDNTNCPIGYEIKDFILIIDMTNSSQAYEVTWANNIQWGNTSPTMTAMVKYMFSFTTIDGGVTWVGNQMFSWQ